MKKVLKRNILLIMLVALFVLVGASTGLAAEPTGNSPDDALTAGRSHSLQPGESVWYTFEYDVDYEESENDAGDKEYQLDPSQVSIWLDSEPEQARTNFEVWTPQRLHQWQAQQDGDEVNPIGRGSENDQTLGDYFWSGKLYETGTYYVRVINESLALSYYTLHIEGKNVRATTNQAGMLPNMPDEEVESETPQPSDEPSATETSESDPVTIEEEVVEEGTSPDNALTPNGEWITLEPGESVWYAFEHRALYEEVENDDGDKEYRLDPSQVSIWLDSEPEQARTNFEVWTPEGLHQWQAQQDGDEVNPIGRGSEDDQTLGDYFWSGKLYESDTYYVRVTNQSSQQSLHLLHLEISK